jgi:hypothetical protein
MTLRVTHLLDLIRSHQLLADQFASNDFAAALPRRDAAPFETQWMRVHHDLRSLGANDYTPEVHVVRKAAYLRAFELTNDPDLAACVSDDLGLLASAIAVAHDDPWLAALWSAYSRQEFPGGELTAVEEPLTSLVQRALRWADFQRRVTFAPASVYHHRTHGWRYIPMHPFGDEPDVLARLGLRPEDCQFVDAWWDIDGDATLLETSVAGASQMTPGLFAKGTATDEEWVYLVAVFDAPYVTRQVFEQAMAEFADFGFPRDRRYRLRPGDRPLRLR